MRVLLAVLVAMMTFDAIFLLAFPQTIKKMVAVLGPGELRIVGAIGLMIAGAVAYYLVTAGS